MNNLPKNIIEIITEYDYGIMCEMHNIGIIINKNKCTLDLLDYCTKHDHINIIKYIIHLDSFEITDADWENLFERAVMYDSVDTVKYIYESEVLIDQEMVCEYIIYAIQTKFDDIVRYFMGREEIDVSYNEFAILDAAVKSLNPNITEMVLAHPHSEDVSYYGNNEPLLTAIRMKNDAIFDIFMQSDHVDPHEPDNEPMRVAIEQSYPHGIEMLMEDEWVMKTLQLNDEELYHLNIIL